MNSFNDIYKILDALKKRLGMYGVAKKVSSLVAFINGLSWSDIDWGKPEFWSFKLWFPVRVEGNSTNLPWQWMIQKWGDEESFNKFFELLDEYRTTERVVLARAVLREHQPRFQRLSVGEPVAIPIPPRFQCFRNRETVTIPIPLELCIVQIHPTQAYYLLEVYMNKHDQQIPYKISISEVKAVAESRWGVLDNEWFNCEIKED
ncbi:MAG: hypothetical protein ACPGVO_15190 [Spirulinaceae cyanobacterium]